MNLVNFTNKIKNIDQQMYRKLLENLVLIAFSITVAELFLRSTKFSIDWPTNFHIVVRYITLAVVFVKLHFDESKKIIRLITLAAFVTIYLLAAKFSGYDTLIDIVVFIIGLKDVSLTKIAKVFFSTVGTLTIIMIIASQTGIIENLVYSHSESRRRRMALGSIYPTDFASTIFFLDITWIYIRKIRLTYLELVMIAVSGILVWYFCDARTCMGCIEIVTAVFFFIKIRERYMKKQHKTEMFRNWFWTLCVIIPIICAAFMIFTSYFYSDDIPILVKLNSFLTGRLTYGKMAFDDYNVRYFGQYVALIGNGGTSLAYLNESNWFIDSSYLNILFKFGIFVFFSVLLILCGSIYKAKKEKDYYLLIIMIIICVQCMIEHHMMELWYNPFIFALFARGTRDNSIGAL